MGGGLRALHLGLFKKRPNTIPSDPNSAGRDGQRQAEKGRDGPRRAEEGREGQGKAEHG